MTTTRRRGAVLWLLLWAIAAPLAAQARAAGEEAQSPDNLPAFPGAEGFGAASRGGRGGRVIKVTNLNTRGPGSLADALAAEGPRIVVFEVSGVIPGELRLGKGKVYIAGQTAPGAGITIAGKFAQDYGKTADKILEDVTIRFIRVRPCDKDGGRRTKDDAIQLPQTRRIIFDHISTSWGRDETVDLYKTHDATVQWSTIEESVWYKGDIHNCGMIAGDSADRVSVHHTLFAHHRSRNPCITQGDADLRNNVIYDYRDGITMYDRPHLSCRFNIVGNYFKRGPSDASTFPFNYLSNGLYYTHDNYISEVGIVQDPWAEAGKHYGLGYHAKRGKRAPKPFDFPPVTTHAAMEAYDLVLREAGCLPHDSVTRRTIKEVRETGGFWGENTSDLLMAGLTPTAAPRDSDGDGMPDAWEQRRGLDPQRRDHRRVMPSGYTAIEQYVNELAEAMIAAQRAGSPIAMAQESLWSGEQAAIAAPPQPAESPNAVVMPAAVGDAEFTRRLAGRELIISLHAEGSKISDAALTALRPMKQLRILSLRNATIGDDGIAHLLRLPALEALDVSGTRVSPAGLRQLQAVPSLRMLDVPTTFSDDALQQLRQALPQVAVERGHN